MFPCVKRVVGMLARERKAIPKPAMDSETGLRNLIPELDSETFDGFQNFVHCKTEFRTRIKKWIPKLAPETMPKLHSKSWVLELGLLKLAPGTGFRNWLPSVFEAGSHVWLFGTSSSRIPRAAYKCLTFKHAPGQKYQNSSLTFKNQPDQRYKYIRATI